MRGEENARKEEKKRMKKMWLFSLGIATASALAGCCCCNQPACVEEDVIILEPAGKGCKKPGKSCGKDGSKCKKDTGKKDVALNIAGCGSDHETAPAPHPAPHPAPAAE